MQRQHILDATIASDGNGALLDLLDGAGEILSVPQQTLVDLPTALRPQHKLIRWYKVGDVAVG